MEEQEKRQLAAAREQVARLLEREASGHGLDHADRVQRLALRFAEEEQADPVLAAWIALLHDVDDYKLFGREQAERLPHARQILQEAGVAEDRREQICSAIGTLGYSKRLRGIEPETLEGRVVSDADMCDALGANGILRTYAFGLASGRPFFDRNQFPEEHLTVAQYQDKSRGTGVDHFFEKILKLKDLMLTGAGKAEAMHRHRLVVAFLSHLFEEEQAPEWSRYLRERCGTELEHLE